MSAISRHRAEHAPAVSQCQRHHADHTGTVPTNPPNPVGILNDAFSLQNQRRTTTEPPAPQGTGPRLRVVDGVQVDPVTGEVLD